MRRLLSFSLLLFHFFHTEAQNSGTVHGVVLDITGDPILGANVYLANTAIGMSVGANGVYTLTKIPAGKYDLVASMIGYKTSTQTLTIENGQHLEIKISLQPEIKLLQEFVKKGKPKATTMEYFRFEKIFLGSTQNAAKCKITNPQVVDAEESNGILTAVAYKPIEIVNEALGYRIIYDLKKFVYSPANTIALIEGPFRFEDLEAKNKKQARQWKKERERAYYGSIMHFIQALKSKHLNNSGFRLQDMHGVDFPWKKLFVDDKSNVIKYNGKLVLIYDRELAERIYDPQRRWQESMLNFSGNAVKIYDNGTFDRFQDMVLEGYLAWSSRIAELLPLAYQPETK